MSTTPSFQQKAVAMVSLTAVSTAIGYAMKVSQVKGKYNYNPMSAVAMTELFKLVISVTIIGRLIASATTEKKSDCKGEAETFAKENYSWTLLAHNVGLAFAYAIVNLVTFGVFAYSSASMFFLLKAASPVITAIMLALLVGRPISEAQWVAIVMQCVGLIATQYDSCRQSTGLPFAAYVYITINIAVSCAAGVWNEHVIKTYNTSVNAQNSMMYAMGTLINVTLFFAVPPSVIGGESGLGFFENYNLTVLAVIAANGSVGLVITAVYKYADVVVKTFGLAGSTMTLFLLEVVGLLPSSGITPSVTRVLGAVIVFYASYVYIAPALMEDVAVPTSAPEHLENGESPSEAMEPRPVSLVRNPRVVILGLLGLGTVLGSVLTARCG